ncbi:MAG: HEAT repeat domain-containing protein [Phycisphaerales bacterium]|nr:HEAT repeat domain-containing protein [Phycisphaerales bacterium]MCI0676983.1 HEAT repeat domain-containing protein [Phycisphaerales bacterium]
MKPNAIVLLVLGIVGVVVLTVAALCALFFGLPFAVTLHDAATTSRLQARPLMESCAKLLELIRHDDPEIRSMAAEALGDRCADSDQAATALIDALSDEDPLVRSSAIWSLRAFKGEATQAALRRIEEDPWKHLAQSALKAHQDGPGQPSEMLRARVDSNGMIVCDNEVKGGWLTSNGIAYHVVASRDPNRSDTLLIQMTLMNARYTPVTIPRPLQLVETTTTFLKNGELPLKMFLQPVSIYPAPWAYPVLQPGESTTNVQAIRFGNASTWPYDRKVPQGVWAAWQNRYVDLSSGEYVIQVEMHGARTRAKNDNDSRGDEASMWTGMFQCQPLEITVVE